jgi:hypothetical protein
MFSNRILVPVELSKLDIQALKVIEESVLVSPDMQLLAQLRNHQERLPA